MLVDQAQTGDEVQIVLNQTPFYAESGGQNWGYRHSDWGLSNFAVENTAKKLGKLHVHVGRVCSGSFKVGQGLKPLSIMRGVPIFVFITRSRICCMKLCVKLWAIMSRKRSLQTSDRTRFDVSHPVAMTMDQIQTVERMVNREIWADTPVVTKVDGSGRGSKSGARALFGENTIRKFEWFRWDDLIITARSFFGRVMRRNACESYRRDRIVQNCNGIGCWVWYSSC